MPDRRLVIFNKKQNLLNCRPCHPGGPQHDNQRRRKERQVLRFCHRTEKAIEHEGDCNTSCNWCAFNDPHRLCKAAARGDGNRRSSGDHSNYNIVKVGQNTEKSPGNLRKLAVTQTPVKKHQLTLVWKTCKE